MCYVRCGSSERRCRKEIVRKTLSERRCQKDVVRKTGKERNGKVEDMRMIIVGCGKIGTTIVSSLVAEGHDVVVVDDDPGVIEEITNIYDAMGVCGNGADNDTLTEAGVEKCEVFAAMTGSDETNMLSCFIAKCLGAKHTIARIRNPEYNDKSLGFLCQQLGLSSSVNPDMLVAKEIHDILKFPSAVNVESFSARRIEMVELVLKSDCPMNGMALYELRRQYSSKFLICAVQREGEVHIPGGNFKLGEGDRIALTAAPSEIQKLLRRLGILQKQARKVMIIGASRISFYLAKLLIANGSSVKVIEKDEARCREFCEYVPEAVVIHGDGAKQEILMEEGIEQMDAFVALTGSDEMNILISIFASNQKLPKVITKVSRPEQVSMAEKLGLDCVVSPRRSVSSLLTRYARAVQNSLGSNVETLHRIMDDKAEVLEFNVRGDFGYMGIPLKEMKLKSNILIAGIIRGRKTLIPSGDDTINQGDKVIVLATGHILGDLGDIIQKQ